MSKSSERADRGRAQDFLELVERGKRGRLKLYIGFAAGVGKTYRMLEEAHALRRRAVDIVVGFVETHGRQETAALLEGLEVIPRRAIAYRGVEIEEMSLNNILQRKPAVAIVDELAHTNVPGSRNPKRYQDVLELLDAGINVIGAFVETPNEAPDQIDAEAQRHLMTNTNLARELGAEVVRLRATDPASAILDFARSHSVGHIVVGRSHRPGWRQLLGRSVPLRLVREASGLDVHVVATEAAEDLDGVDQGGEEA